MAQVIIVLDKDELEEFKELCKYIKVLKKRNKEKLLGFLKAVEFTEEINKQDI